jgi:Flp pilus assembly protein TadD
MTLLASDSSADARKYPERAIQLDPDNAVAHYHLSQASRRAGDLEQASREMNKFIVLKAENEALKKSLNRLPPRIQPDTSNEHR